VFLGDSAEDGTVSPFISTSIATGWYARIDTNVLFGVLFGAFLRCGALRFRAAALAWGIACGPFAKSGEDGRDQRRGGMVHALAHAVWHGLVAYRTDEDRQPRRFLRLRPSLLASLTWLSLRRRCACPLV
jgi:hypothetical protein